MGILPLATNCPPARRTAEANGAAQVFSHTNTAAELPGSIAAATAVTSSSLSSLERAVLVLLQDQQVKHPDELPLHQISKGRGDLAVEPAAGELDNDPVNRAKLIDGFGLVRRSPPSRSTILRAP